MKFLIPQTVQIIYKTLSENDFSVYLVGGCIRNIIMELPIKDWDLATNATPTEIQKLFPNSYYENKFGTVKIPMDDEKKDFVEVTTFRHESGYLDSRHPENVEWGKTIEDDLSRRDFTCNALAATIKNGKIDTIIDPYDGQKDIDKKMIRAVGNPDKRLQEDALRLMRAVRFATQLGFTIDPETKSAIQKHAALLQKISWERIRDELLKILASEMPEKGIHMLDEVGLLQYILPELLDGKDVSQVRPGRHHTTDVYTHNLMTLRYTPSADPIVRLAALLHDVGKPATEGKDESGFVIFHNHEVEGAKIAHEIAERLKLSKKQKEKIVTLIRWHMFSIDETVTDHAVRKFLRRVGVENVKDMIDLRIGDRLGSGTQTAESWRLKRFKDMIERELNPPFSLNDLAIDGNDIMRELNLKPGRKIGEILKKLFDEVDEDLSKNKKDYLIKRVHQIHDGV